MTKRIVQKGMVAVCFMFAGLASSTAFAYDLEGLKGDAMGKMDAIRAKIMKNVYSEEIRSKGMLKKMDADSNKSVTAAEYMNYIGDVFDSMDADSDNEIDTKEWQAAKNSESLMKLMTPKGRQELLLKATMNTIDDNDQSVDRDEFVDFHQGIFEDMEKKGKDKSRIEY